MQQPTLFLVYSVQSCDTQKPTFGRPQQVLNLRQVGRHGEQRVFVSMYSDSPVEYFVDIAVFFKNIVYTRGVSIPRGQCHRRPICIYYFLESPGMQRCRLPVDPRGTAVTVTGRSQRTRIRSGIFDFRSVHLIEN